MTVIVTLAQTGSDINTSWSKEAIVALVTMFIMMLLSSLGFLWRYRIRIWALIRRRRWSRLVPQGMNLHNQF
jgi:hypothetical protein